MASYTFPSAVCADGLTSQTFEQRSAAASGRTVEQWRQAVIDALKNAKKGAATARRTKSGKTIGLTGTEAERFRALGNAMSPNAETGAAPTVGYSSPADLDALLDGKVPNFKDFGSYSSRERPMWAYLKEMNLAYEKDWQHQTSISFVETVPDGVDKKGKPKTKVVAHSVEADKIPYVVRRGSFQPPWGSFVKVTDINTGKTTYARVLEGGPTEEGTEASLKVYENLGYSDVTPNESPTGKLQYDVIGNPPKGGFNRNLNEGLLSNEETQLAGDLMSSGKSGYIGTHQELYDKMNDIYGANAREEAAKRGVKFPDDMKTTKEKAEAKKNQTSGLMLMKGFQTVAIGPQQKLVGYADTACIHQGGGSVMEGSCTVYVGLNPMSRIGDKTTDSYNVVSGDETVLIGGEPTSTKLAMA